MSAQRVTARDQAERALLARVREHTLIRQIAQLRDNDSRREQLIDQLRELPHVVISRCPLCGHIVGDDW